MYSVALAFPHAVSWTHLTPLFVRHETRLFAVMRINIHTHTNSILYSYFCCFLKKFFNLSQLKYLLTRTALKWISATAESFPGPPRLGDTKLQWGEPGTAFFGFLERQYTMWRCIDLPLSLMLSHFLTSIRVTMIDTSWDGCFSTNLDYLTEDSTTRWIRAQQEKL